MSSKLTLNQYANRLVQYGSAFHVHYWGVMPKHYDNLLHKHSFFEICYVLDGKGSYIDETTTYELEKNTMFFSRPEVLHQIKSEEGLALVYVAFELINSESSEEWNKIMKEAEQCSEIVINVEEESTAALLWKSLLIESKKNEKAFFEEMLTNLSYSLIVSLLQAFVPSLKKDNHNSSPETSPSLLNVAKLHIKDNLSGSLKLTDVARHLHISGRHLSRIFVSELGISYSEFVQNERVQRAATLLKTTDLSIKDIAEETGFTSVHYFTRVFTSALRHSPGRFRSLYTDLKETTYKDE
ncbi:AraC family transcriptional regulator [Bacillus taeanensis]|uniref:AraC family transcriptional regulator n=2 Tax=Bacillus taeanensis TaxID=273032 RepID=A0A366XX87_9BACI|nr:AraC family transcriptional regulator [Bacillus taeanensis]